MDQEEERAYKAALAEVTAPGAVDIAEPKSARAEDTDSQAAIKVEPDATPGPSATTAQADARVPHADVEAGEGVPKPTPKRTLRFAEEDLETKPKKRARFASLSPPPSADAGPSRQARFASPDSSVAAPKKRPRFVSPPPAPASDTEDEQPPKRARMASPPPPARATDSVSDAERPSLYGSPPPQSTTSQSDTQASTAGPGA